MKRIVLSAAALLLLAPVGTAQERHGRRHDRKDRQEMRDASENRDVKVLSYQSKRIGERLDLDFDINYDRLILAPNEMLVITPVLRHEGQEMVLRPVVFMGERCYRHEQRKPSLAYENAAETVVLTNKQIRERHKELRKNGNDFAISSPRTVHYVASFPYMAWMDGAKVVLHHDYATSKALIYEYSSVLGTLHNPTPVTPKVMFVVPEYEAVKSRSESMTARVVFEVNKTEIKRGIFGNDVELDRIYKFTDNIINNKDLKISSVELTGYASPEGRYSHNQALATGRVNSMKSLLQQKYTGVAKNLYTTNAVAEDWDSLRSWVAASDLQHRAQILDIIDSTPDADARDAKIRALDKSATYNMLLHDVYPGLRRTEYTIQYVVVPFTVERGKEVIKTNPSHLSLQEFFQIAETYPIDSKEYEDTFAMALRYFPNDPVANNNMAAIALRKGDLAKARTYLSKVGDYPAAQNNIGILNALEGRYDVAERAFRNAILNGSTEAEYNLEHINSLK